MTDINRTRGSAAEEEFYRSTETESVYRSIDPALFDEFEVADPSDADQSESDVWLEDAQRRRFVTDLAWMSEDEMADLNAQQQRNRQAVTYLTPEQQLAWRETPRPGWHMEVR